MTSLLRSLVSGALLVVGVALALRAPDFRPALDALVPAYPYATLAGGTILAWRFGRGRLALSLLALFLAERGLARWAPPGLLGETVARTVAGSVAVLLPLDLAALAWLPDRSMLARSSRIALALLGFEVALVALLCQPLFEPFTGWLDPAWPHRPTVRVPVAGLVAGGVALVTLAVRVVRYRSALEAGSFWALVAVLAAVGTGAGGLEASMHLATAGLVLLVALIETWHRMAYIDELTGLPARRALNEMLEGASGRYVVAMVDIDHFKSFNDRFGHGAGDQLLRMIAARLGEVGGGGRAFRYGGEEFAIVFPGRAVPEVIGQVEALRQRIEATPFTLRGPDRPPERPERVTPPGPRHRARITVSIGVAGGDGQTSSPDDVVRAADAALYRAKASGRNRVRL
ncbi:MAG TPA: GGDEF domain-containing protein [Candidatus Tectomicrobia bacterium]|nr:GGDEF domain-containing protein [Candidatus Tectomicrobia bacterium]